MRITKFPFLAAGVFLVAGAVAWAVPDPAVLSIDAGAPGTAVSPDLYGVFFEDINDSADGGLYPELVQNRSFEFRRGTEAWRLLKEGQQPKFTIGKTEGLNPSNTHFGRLQVAQPGPGITNAGFGGMVLVPGETYKFSVYLRSQDSSVSSVKVDLETEKGTSLGTLTISGIDAAWKMYTGTLQVKEKVDDGRLTLRPLQAGTVDIDMVSLFPGKTFKDRPNGLRTDLAALVGDVHPKFVRFPGGCNVQGKTMATAYRWKETLGDVAQRKANDNFWGYYQSNGLGFYEYFQYCEDIGAEPVPVLNAGMAFQDSGEVVPFSSLGTWIQDALDLVEYANGDTTTTWGSVRAKSGHPAPFNMKVLEIGNEQWGTAYFQRYKMFADAFRAKHPEIQLILSAGPLDSGPIFDDAWNQSKVLPVDIVDEHYYMSPEWYLSNTHRYDSYNRKGPKVFLGEYAAQVDGKRNNLYAALAEAAFMTGLERNGDVVKLASYAPLYAKDGSTQWAPDMIWFNNEKAYGSPSYYVQKMFASNQSTVTLPTTVQDASAKVADTSVVGGVGLGTWATQVEYKELKVTDPSGKVLFAPAFNANLDDWTAGRGDWSVKNGVMAQKSTDTECTVTYQGEGWKGAQINLKARKIDGAEGMLIMFGVQGNQYYWWNIGGWGNTQSAIEKVTGSSRGIVGKGVPLSVDTNRWYDIRIELKDQMIRCYLNNKLIHDLKVPGAPGSFFTHVGRGDHGEIIIKAVNLGDQPKPVRFQLANAPALQPQAQVSVLANEAIDAENSFSDPLAVSTKELVLDGVSADFTYPLAPHSVTVLRLVPVGR